MSILAEVVRAGLATVQDGGRHGLSGIGVPVSGAWHRQRYFVATALIVGRPDGRVPAIEVLDGLVELHLHRPVALALVGPAALEVDDQRAAVGAVISCPSDSRVRVEHLGPGPAYLVLSDWMPARLLGSASTDTFSGLGGGPLAAGDLLLANREPGRGERVGAFHRALGSASGPIRIVAAGHPHLSALTAARWTVSRTARSGVRLIGAALPSAPPIASMPVLPGAVQSTPGGEAIVLGPDGGLTGGYPVLGVVATCDLDRLSLVSSGDIVTFREIDVAEAAAANRARTEDLAGAVVHPGQVG